ncbi:MAG: hypothetical protein N3G20_11085 [Verrucomicrobiae bacterium]|nr:hypothetical protein [Verrucomicrobiae bacterium]
MNRDADQANPVQRDTVQQARERAFASAELALSLAELLRAGAGLPQALMAIAARRRWAKDRLAPVFERIAVAVCEEGKSPVQAVMQERGVFSDRFIAILALANLAGPLFKTFIEWSRQAVLRVNALPPHDMNDFPPMTDEVQEFCFFFGHLLNERASQPEIQRWLPRIFTTKLRLQATLVLARFFEQGLLLSEAFARTPPFNDPEMVLAVQAGEQLDRVGRELIELSRWWAERRALQERLRLTDYVVPPAIGLDSGSSVARADQDTKAEG